jgi:hypothetical protein
LLTLFHPQHLFYAGSSSSFVRGTDQFFIAFGVKGPQVDRFINTVDYDLVLQTKSQLIECLVELTEDQLPKSRTQLNAITQEQFSEELDTLDLLSGSSCWARRRTSRSS